MFKKMCVWMNALLLTIIQITFMKVNGFQLFFFPSSTYHGNVPGLFLNPNKISNFHSSLSHKFRKTILNENKRTTCLNDNCSEISGNNQIEPDEKKLNFKTTHLVSLSSLKPSSPQSLRDIWKWKDIALGDGRDYFIPRPRAISDLQSLFLRNSHKQYDCKENLSNYVNCTVEECAILSNCARLDIFLSIQTTCNYDKVEAPCTPSNTTSTTSFNDTQRNVMSSMQEILQLEVALITAQILANQLESYRKIKMNQPLIIESISNLFDLPGVINVKQPYSQSKTQSNSKIIDELSNSLTVTTGIEDITRHACLVAAGMKDRPSRPGRAVLFRPFSSRDAHIMLQMKRTVELTQGKKLKTILQAGLQAGKAARNPNKVPEINPLKAYNSGEGGRYSKPDPPLELVKKATKAAKALAIEPTVMKCVSNLSAMEAAGAISNLRKNAQTIISNCDLLGREKEVLKDINQILHKPTIALREGKFVNEEDILVQIKKLIKIKYYK